ncbi:hypothetical protein FSP39_023169 [Pinctada imbricata]|uniref:Uncharacterized protein n=1 Tax=Pinctada imbricata TaxID=66713 RepID=A0AA89C7F6_PINIB|nr:hypothetical protein FSP39_023169 [Pinctada imbricata]
MPISNECQRSRADNDEILFRIFRSIILSEFQGLRVVSPVQSPELPPRSPRTRKLDLKPHDRSPHLQRSATARDLSPTSPSPPVLSPTLSSPQLNALGYSNKSGNYRGTAFQPPLTNRSASSGSNMSNQSEYENVRQYKGFETGSQDSGFSSNNNMYNLMTQRKSHYESTDELKTPTHGCNDSVFSDRQYSRHGSLDGSFRKQSSSQQNYGSLERNSRRWDHWSQRDRQLSDSEASVHLSELEPSRFGSKRNSQSEYDLTSPRNNVVEVPVHHEQTRGNHRRYKSTPWEDSAIMEQSPIIQSPDKDFEKQCYSPRLHEGNFFSNKGQIPYSTDQNSAKSTESPRYSRQSNALVTVTKIQPHRNVEVVSKPFEMSDFYKYSEKIRRQRMIDQYQQQLMGGSRCSSPSQHSTDSGDNSSLHSGSNSSYHHHHSVIHSPTQPSPAHSTVSINSPYKSGQTYVSNSRQNSPFRDHEQQYKSPPSHRSAKFQAVKEQSTHVQYTMQTPSGARVYKSVQTRHTHYQPLTPQKCDPIRNQVGTPVKSHNSNASGSTPKTMERSSRLKTTVPQPCMSPGLLDVSLGPIVGENFSEEVMEWIDQKNPSYV